MLSLPKIAAEDFRAILFEISLTLIRLILNNDTNIDSEV